MCNKYRICNLTLQAEVTDRLWVSLIWFQSHIWMTFSFHDTSGIVWSTKFEENKLIWALLVFNLTHFLKNNTRQRKDEEKRRRLGVSFNVSSCCLWNLPWPWVGLSKYSVHAVVRHTHIKLLPREIAKVGLEKACFSWYTNCILCLGLRGGGHYQYWCQWHFFSHSTDSWIESLLRNHGFKENDLLFYQYWPIYTSTFLREHKQYLTETLYVFYLLAH